MLRRELIFATLSALMLISCNKETNLRQEYINVYHNGSQNAVSSISVPPAGIEDGVIDVHTNAPLDISYRQAFDSDENTWFMIKSVESVGDDCMRIRYCASSLIEKNSIDLRTGTISLSNSSLYLGKYLPVRQGYDLVKEVSSSVDLIDEKGTYTTEKITDLNKSTSAIVSFNAYAQTGYEAGGKNISLDIELRGGAVFNGSGRTSFRVNVKTGTDPDSSNFHYLLFANEDLSLLSQDTMLHFSVKNPKGTVVYVSNIKIYKVKDADLGDLVFEE